MWDSSNSIDHVSGTGAENLLSGARSGPAASKPTPAKPPISVNREPWKDVPPPSPTRALPDGAANGAPIIRMGLEKFREGLAQHPRLGLSCVLAQCTGSVEHWLQGKLQTIGGSNGRITISGRDFNIVLAEADVAHINLARHASRDDDQAIIEICGRGGAGLIRVYAEPEREPDERWQALIDAFTSGATE